MKMDLKQSFIDIIAKHVGDNTVTQLQIREDFESALTEIFSNLSISPSVASVTPCTTTQLTKTDHKEEKINEKIKKDGCKHIFLKGKNAGTMCGSGKKDLCAKHKPKIKEKNIEETPKPLTPKVVKKVKKVEIKVNPPKVRLPKKLGPNVKLPKGAVVTGILGTNWTLGPAIGKGGFGEIYSAYKEDDEGTIKEEYPFAVKIEPHSNGPLFTEMHFYMRAAKLSSIDKFKKTKHLEMLGMPEHIDHGSHTYNDEKYRFIVMEKFGSDIWNLFVKKGKYFEPPMVLKLSVQTLDVLEYIHSQGYIHADIKGANMLLKPNDHSQVYLVDFGLCCHYDKDFKPDKKKAHNGTLEYVSRDGHQGVQSRRGDLEILGYNMIQWSGGILPWNNLKDPKMVHESKVKYMDDLNLFFDTSFPHREKGKAFSSSLRTYFEAVCSMTFKDIDYDHLKKILTTSNDYVDNILFI
jgi:vaccinia related kinase